MSSARFGATLATATALAFSAAFQSVSAWAEPAVKYMDVRNARLPYVEEGSGTPVVFVHGAAGDYRSWNPQRSALAKEGYRAISYTQRYFGSEPWLDNGPQFSVKTHADDLAGFIMGLGAGPVHVVTWSYSGQVALSVALDHPELVRSAFLFEPSYPTYVTDSSVLKLIRDDAATTFGPYAKAAKEGNKAEAVRQLINGVGGGADYFVAQPPDVQSRQLDSASAVLQMSKAPPPVPISCEQLGMIKSPTVVVSGSDTRPYFMLIANEAARCMPTATLITVPDATHMWPGEQPAKFTAMLIDFLKAQ